MSTIGSVCVYRELPSSLTSEYKQPHLHLKRSIRDKTFTESAQLMREHGYKIAIEKLMASVSKDLDFLKIVDGTPLLPLQRFSSKKVDYSVQVGDLELPSVAHILAAATKPSNYHAHNTIATAAAHGYKLKDATSLHLQHDGKCGECIRFISELSSYGQNTDQLISILPNGCEYVRLPVGIHSKFREHRSKFKIMKRLCKAVMFNDPNCHKEVLRAMFNVYYKYLAMFLLDLQESDMLKFYSNERVEYDERTPGLKMIDLLENMHAFNEHEFAKICAVTFPETPCSRETKLGYILFTLHSDENEAIILPSYLEFFRHIRAHVAHYNHSIYAAAGTFCTQVSKYLEITRQRVVAPDFNVVADKPSEASTTSSRQ